MKEIAEKIKSTHNIVITAHISEDPDAVGSMFALGTALKSIGKNVTILLSDIPEEKLQFLECDYLVFKDNLKLEQDLIICLDAADLNRLGSRKILLEKSFSISLDHHYTNTNYADINYVEGDASSTGELVFLLLKELDIKISKKIAEFLYIAISGDTGSFKYSCTSPRTMRIVAELMEQGIDHSELSRRLHENEKLEVVLLKGYAMSNIKSFYENRLRMIAIDSDTFEQFGVTEKNVGDIVNIPRMIEETEIAVSVRETPEKIKISFRSNGKFNVSEIAAHFGGGGHVMAAGASLFGKKIGEVVEEIVKVVGDYIND